MATRDTTPTSTASIQSNITLLAGQVPLCRDSASASPPTSTPPTSLGDDTSVLSEQTKMEQAMELHQDTEALVETTTIAEVADPPSAPDTPNTGRERPQRASRGKVKTYNVQILAGTAIHTPTKYLEVHHKNVLHAPIEEILPKPIVSPPKKRTPRPKSSPQVDADDSAEHQLATEVAQAVQRRTSRGTDLRRQAALNLSGVGETVASTLASGKDYVLGALRRSASDSRLRSSFKTAPTASPKRTRAGRNAEADESSSAEQEDKRDFVKPKTKQWMTQGLFVGQTRDFNARLSESQNRARRKSRSVKESKVLPLPMFSYADTLEKDPRISSRDFKLPFDVYNPLPRKVKVDGWVKLSKNRFIGDASALWKRDKQDASQCYCEPEDGCGEACHNRIMAYECDETNCRLTEEQCGNRPFAQLKKRAKGNGYDYGVEVMETEGKGYGVRAMRTFDAHQIIVEYAGEIITQQECERRMKQVYKKDKCYYLMSFDNKMIIDATRGTIARFVNHSCEPNCEMIKWTVRGEPRMALFAGKRGIMSGEELTYDYNFDPFSSKNIQECHCGTASCRGVLGPKLKKPAYEEKSLAGTIMAGVAGTKRKLQEVFSGKGSDSASSSPKKRKIGNSAQTKAMNQKAQQAAAREKAKLDAAALAAQLASRKDRANKRNQALLLSKRSTVTRAAVKTTLPTIKKSHTTATMMRSALNTVVKRKNVTLSKTVKKGLRPNQPALSKMRASTPEEEEVDEDSPNITPASLRSASKKQLVQSKLSFEKAKPLTFVREPSSLSKKTAHPSPKVPKEIPDSDVDMDEEDDEEQELGRKYAQNAKGKKRANYAAPRGMHSTGTGIFKFGKRGKNTTGQHTAREMKK